jgi:N-acetylglucosaminyldiphosphoundecaprenol N-acetyl-beta-D-mannosaminyltransferase
MKALIDTAAALINHQIICQNENDIRIALSHIKNAAGLRIVSFLNKDAIIIAQHHEEFRNALKQADFLFRDGVGAEIIMKCAELEPGLNMNGTDLIPRIISMYSRDDTIALYGSSEAALSSSKVALYSKGYSKVEALNGFKKSCEYLSHLRQSRARLVVLGMGMPKQELVAQAIKNTPEFQSRDIIVINGGAIIDFMGGKVTRAPTWMRRARLEWVYRTYKEPVRLLWRTLSTIPLLAKTYMVGTQIKQRVIEIKETVKHD